MGPFLNKHRFPNPGIPSGKDGGEYFAPKAYTTRAEAAKVLTISVMRQIMNKDHEDSSFGIKQQPCLNNANLRYSMQIGDFFINGDRRSGTLSPCFPPPVIVVCNRCTGFQLTDHRFFRLLWKRSSRALLRFCGGKPRIRSIFRAWNRKGMYMCKLFLNHKTF